MAGHKAKIGNSIVFLDYADCEGSAIVNGRELRWEFAQHFGPLFLRKDGEPMQCQNPGKPVWDAFEKWLEKYLKEKPEL